MEWEPIEVRIEKAEDKLDIKSLKQLTPEKPLDKQIVANKSGENQVLVPKNTAQIILQI